MRQYIINTILFCAGLLTIQSCLDPYNPSTTTANPSYLVVEGFLNSTDNSCTIKLSHSIPLKSDTTAVPPPETKAQVKLEDDNGATYVLKEGVKGEYSISNLSLSSSKNYRIRLVTSSHIEYLSDFVPIVQTPPIDSITYGNQREGVHINVNTHDDNNNTHYYEWRYTDTWVYDAAFDSEFIYKNGQAVLRPQSIFQCWKTVASTDILLSSSVKLQQDIISNFNLKVIPWQSPRLQIKYSIEVEQHSLTKDAFEYWSQVKKNTESLGTLFAPLPTRIIGNFQCLTNPEEPVIGYFSAGSLYKKRIFITSKDIKRPLGVPYFITGYEGCQLDSALIVNGVFGELVSLIEDEEENVIGFMVSTTGCVDCRLQGGTIVKPDFWQ